MVSALKPREFLCDFKFFMAVTVNSTVVWNVTYCLAEIWARGCSIFLHDVSDFLPDDRTSHSNGESFCGCQKI